MCIERGVKAKGWKQRLRKYLDEKVRRDVMRGWRAEAHTRLSCLGCRAWPFSLPSRRATGAAAESQRCHIVFAYLVLQTKFLYNLVVRSLPVASSRIVMNPHWASSLPPRAPRLRHSHSSSPNSTPALLFVHLEALARARILAAAITHVPTDIAARRAELARGVD